MNDVSSADPMVALAQLMLNADDLRAQSDEDALRAARQDQRQALGREMAALHEAADKQRVGAWVEGLATGAGGLMSASAHLFTPLGKNPTGRMGALLEGGQALERLAGPAGRELGEAPSMDAQAEAKQAEQESADAATRAELANRDHDRVLDDQERTIGRLETILESESQGDLAIIANV